MYELKQIKQVVKTISSFSDYYVAKDVDDWVGDDEDKKGFIKNVIKDIEGDEEHKPVAILIPKSNYAEVFEYSLYKYIIVTDRGQPFTPLSNKVSVEEVIDYILTKVGGNLWKPTISRTLL